MVIDTNMYWVPESVFTDEKRQEAFLAELNSHPNVFARVENIASTGKKQVVIECPKGYPNLNYVQGEYNIDQQLRDMEVGGVDKVILKIPGFHAWIGTETAKRLNDEMTEHVQGSHGVMAALGVIDPLDVEGSRKEIVRCIEQLGMKGIQLSTHYGDRYLDDPCFEKVFEVLNAYEMPVYVHHSPIPVEFDSIYAYDNLRRSYGRIMDQAIAVSREVQSGLFGRYPKVKMVHSMLGGAYFSVMDSMYHKRPQKKADTVQRFQTDTDDLLEQLKNNVFYELSHAQPWGGLLLETAISILGEDHILFGSSYPVRAEWMTEGAETVRKLSVSNEAKEKILHENAERIYHI